MSEIINLQKFAEEQDNQNESQSQPIEYVEKVDPVTRKSIKIPKELEVFLGHTISSTRSQTEDKYKTMIDQLQNEAADLPAIRAELEKIQEEKMTAEERAASNAKKKIDEANKNAEKYKDFAENWKRKFEESTIKNDILSSFGDTKLCNPSQTAYLLEREGNARVEEIIDAEGKPTGRFETKLSLQIENEDGNIEDLEGTPLELFKKWINQERNLHHQVIDIKSGGDTKRIKTVGGRIDYSKLSPTERMNIHREQGRAK